MNEREPTIEEQFLIDLRRLLADASFGERTPMLARFAAKNDSGGPGGTDFDEGKLIPVRAGVLVFLWPLDAATGDRPSFVAHMVSEPEGAWTDVPQPASIEVRGRLAKSSALVIDLDHGRLRSLHPTTTRRFRTPRLGV